MKKPFAEQGFTLVEFLIYTMLLSVVMMILVTISISTLRTRTVANIDLVVQRNIDVAFHTIVKSVENANTITTPASGQSSILEITGEDVTSYPAIFSISDGKIMYSKAGAPEEQITSDDVLVTSFIATRMADPLDGVQIKLSLETRNVVSPELFASETVQTTIMLSY